MTWKIVKINFICQKIIGPPVNYTYSYLTGYVTFHNVKDEKSVSPLERIFKTTSESKNNNLCLKKKGRRRKDNFDL